MTKQLIASREATDEEIVSRIYMIRGQKVMLDKDLAEMDGVEVKVLNQSVKSNPARFPEDFMFQLSNEEGSAPRSQIVTLEKGKGRYPKFLP